MKWQKTTQVSREEYEKDYLWIVFEYDTGFSMEVTVCPNGQYCCTLKDKNGGYLDQILSDNLFREWTIVEPKRSCCRHRDIYILDVERGW